MPARGRDGRPAFPRGGEDVRRRRRGGGAGLRGRGAPRRRARAGRRPARLERRRVGPPDGDPLPGREPGARYRWDAGLARLAIDHRPSLAVHCVFA